MLNSSSTAVASNGGELPHPLAQLPAQFRAVHPVESLIGESGAQRGPAQEIGDGVAVYCSSSVRPSVGKALSGEAASTLAGGGLRPLRAPDAAGFGEDDEEWRSGSSLARTVTSTPSISPTWRAMTGSAACRPAARTRCSPAGARSPRCPACGAGSASPVGRPPAGVLARPRRVRHRAARSPGQGQHSAAASSSRSARTSASCWASRLRARPVPYGAR